MLRLTVLISLFVFAITEKILGVNYSFDVDFNTTFNSKRCDNEDMWRLVRYEDLEIEPLHSNSSKAIQAVEKSCASSFPIIFVGGTIEVNVYSQEISQFLNLRIYILGEDDMLVTSYIHRRSNKDFKSGWHTISLNINTHIMGYIHLRGRSLKNEILLIDSFRYIPNNTMNTDDLRPKRSVDSEREDEDEMIFKYRVYNDQYENSGDEEYETTDTPVPTDAPSIEDREKRNTFWNPFTISLVAFGAGVVIMILVVGAYNYGKVRAVDNALLPFDNIEPPQTITIPRVNGRSNRRNPVSYYGY